MPDASTQTEPPRKGIAIAVLGTAYTPQKDKKAQKLGEAIAKRGHILVTGECPDGIPGAAVEGAKQRGGFSLGISPEAHHKNTDTKANSDFVVCMADTFTGRSKQLIQTCPICVAYKGSNGTLAELAFAYNNDVKSPNLEGLRHKVNPDENWNSEPKIIALLLSEKGELPGIADQFMETAARLNKRTNVIMVVETDPDTLIQQSIHAYENRFKKIPSSQEQLFKNGATAMIAKLPNGNFAFKHGGLRGENEILRKHVDHNTLYQLDGILNKKSESIVNLCIKDGRVCFGEKQNFLAMRNHSSLAGDIAQSRQ